MTIEQRKIYNKGIIDGVICVLENELISIEDFWSQLLGLDFEKDEVLNTRIGDFLVSEILELYNLKREMANENL